MKIVYFNYMWDLWGVSLGSTIKALELFKALSKFGHEVKFYWRRDDINRKSDMSPNGSTTREFLKKYLSRYLHEPNQILKNIPSIREELAILEQEKPDLVISRLESYSYSPVTLAKKTKIPFIIEVDSPSSYEKIVFQSYYRSTKWLLYWIENKSIMAAKAAFAQSNQVKDYYVKHGIPEDKFTVIPNGVDPQKFNPEVDISAVKKKYKLNDSVVIGFVGSFIYWHGVENLTSIIENAVESHKDVKFLMVGDGGPMKPYLQKFIKEKGFEERVILTGLVEHEEIPQYITAMDIVLAPYPKLEFFYYSPVKVYEYMSCGRAIITTNIGQIAEIIDDQRNGFLTEPDDIAAISDIISQLIKEPQLRKKVGATARKDVIEKHSWEKRGEQLSQLCLECIN